MLMEAQQNLVQFIEYLRSKRNFNIGIDQYFEVTALIKSLKEHKNLPKSPEKLKSLLSPILCKSPQEQSSFYLLFDQWMTPQKESQEIKKSILEKKSFNKRKFTLYLIILLLSFLTIFAFIFYNWEPKTFDLNGSVINEADLPLPNASVTFLDKSVITDSTGSFHFTYSQKDTIVPLIITHSDFSTPLHEKLSLAVKSDSLKIQFKKNIQSISRMPRFTLDRNEFQLLVNQIDSLADKSTRTVVLGSKWQLFYNQHFPKIRFFIIVIIFSATLFWHQWRRIRQNLIFKRFNVLNSPQLHDIWIDYKAENIYQADIFRRISHGFRTFEPIRTVQLEIDQTIEKTVKNAGMFTPIWKSIFISPQYLVLIERKSYQDQLANFADEITNNLKESGIYIDRYFFEGDARIYYPENINEPLLSLSQLFSKHPDHRLLIISEGKSFFNPFTGKPENWLEKFSHWKAKVIFTPATPQKWDYRTLQLAKLDFQIFPLTQTGLKEYVSTIQTGKYNEFGNAYGNFSNFPDLLKYQRLKWINAIPPDSIIQKQLIRQLKIYLDDKGFLLLSACAVYPEIKWELLLCFGKEIRDEKQVEYLNETRLLMLLRLPWFQEGFIPDWLRKALVNELSRKQVNQIFAILDRLFSSATLEKKTGLELTIANATSNVKTVLKRALNLSGKSIIKQPLDYIFVAVNRKKRISPHTPKIPQKFRQILFYQGIKPLGLRSWINYLLGFICSFIIWVSIPTIQLSSKIESTIPRFEILNYSNPTLSPQKIFDVALSDSHWQYYARNLEKRNIQFNKTVEEMVYFAWLQDTLQQVGLDITKYKIISIGNIDTLLSGVGILKHEDWLALNNSGTSNTKEMQMAIIADETYKDVEPKDEGFAELHCPAFFIAPQNKDIIYFKINIKPSNSDVRNFISLRERQVFMPNDPYSPALALLEDIAFETTGDSIYKSVGSGVCINPKTPVNADSPRYNPGETVVLFVASNQYANQDWERAKAYFKANKDKLPEKNYYDITIEWDIPPGDTTNSLKIPVRFNAVNTRVVEKNYIPEEMSRFKHQPEKSLIRKEVAKHYGETREKSLYFVQWEDGPFRLEQKYRYRVVFRVW